jgi:hypothetical protein
VETVAVADELELSCLLQEKTIAVTRMAAAMSAWCFRFINDRFVFYTAKIDQWLRREKPIVVNVLVFGVNAGNASFY